MIQTETFFISREEYLFLHAYYYETAYLVIKILVLQARLFGWVYSTPMWHDLFMVSDTILLEGLTKQNFSKFMEKLMSNN